MTTAWQMSGSTTLTAAKFGALIGATMATMCSDRVWLLG
jgi:hypothetical protein